MASSSFDSAGNVKWRAEKEVFAHYVESQEYFKIEHHITNISKLCFEEKLISEKTHGKILHIKNKLKAALLLKAIQQTMERSKDCFELFLYILKKTGLCDELVHQLKVSVEQTIERMHKAQATRRKRASQREDAIQTAVLKNLEELTGACECLLMKIASECQTKSIISKETYEGRAKALKDKKSKTSWFLKCVCFAVRKDNKKYETFIEILNKHPSCRTIVQKIKQSVEQFKASKTEMVATPSVGLPPSHQIVFPKLQALMKHFSANADQEEEANETSCSASPVGSTIVTKPGIQASTTDTASTSGMCHLRNSRSQETAYQQAMEKQQNEARNLDDLKKQNELLSNDKCQMLIEINLLRQKLSDKQNELAKIEREKEDLVNEVETLSFALKKAEKSEVEQVLKQKIAEKEAEIEVKNKKINELEKQQGTLQQELSEKDKDLSVTRQLLNYTLQTLQEFQTLNRQKSQENQEMHMQNRKIIYCVLVVVVVITILFIYQILK